jgi:thiamine biosynthesis protein ThiS
VNTLKINGNDVNLVSPIMLADLLLMKNYNPEKIAIELNGKIVPKKEYRNVTIGNLDSLEIVSFVGGG